jgi:putative transposase
MARMPRIVLPGQPQLISQRGHPSQVIFRSGPDYRFFLDSLDTAAQRYGGDVHAYVLMADHVQLLITPHAEDSLARILQQVGRAFARYLSAAYQRSGGLWDGRYKATIIDSEQYLLACYRYVELDPVREQRVVQPGEYPWSSYRAHALGEPDALIHDHPLYQALGPTPGARSEAYRASFHSPQDESSMAAIQTASVADGVLGSDRFKAELMAALERRSATLPAAWARHREHALVDEE